MEISWEVRFPGLKTKRKRLLIRQSLDNVYSATMLTIEYRVLLNVIAELSVPVLSRYKVNALSS